MRALGSGVPLPAIDATSNEAASSTATPPVNPELVRAAEVPGATKLGSNVFEILVFRGLSTPLALLLVVLQGRFLEPSGRGRFVLAVLTVTIFSRLLSQLGVAVANHMSQREWDTEPELRPLAQRALGSGAATFLSSFFSGLRESFIRQRRLRQDPMSFRNIRRIRRRRSPLILRAARSIARIR